MKKNLMSVRKSSSDRILYTPSAYARRHYLYVQEAGSLKSLEPHVSSRQKLHSILFLLVTEGEGHITIDGKTYAMQAGSCAFIDCRGSYAHESSQDKPWSLRWVHFCGEDAMHYASSYAEMGFSPVFTPSDVVSLDLILRHIYECCSGQGFLEELKLNRYLTDLVSEVFLAQEKVENSGRSKFTEIRSYMEEHLGEKLSLEVLAEEFYMSKYHLSREYTKLFGTSLITDLNAMRISKAKSALRFSDDAVELIGETCGFSDSAYFIHVFKDAEGITPLQYRKRWRG